MSSSALTTNPRLQIQDQSLLHVLRAVYQAAPASWLAGGAVRDLLRGATPSDLDFVTTADARKVAESIAASLSGSAFVLDETRGQWRVALDGPLKSIDIGGIESGGLEDDLRRRDFTVDALASRLQEDGSLGDVIDVTGGLADLQDGVLRMTREWALHDDPLRMLRAVRLALELGFEIEAQTASAITKLASQITTTAGELQRDEMVHILATDRSADGIRLMDSLGLLAHVLPELLPAKGVEQPGEHHYWDVFDHSVETLATLDAMFERDEAAAKPTRIKTELRAYLDWYPLDDYLDEDAGGHSRRELIKLAGLLHDISKPETKGLDEKGHIHFFGHPEQGAEKTVRICERLRFGTKETRFVSLLVEEHLRPTMLSPRGGVPSARALYRFFRDLDDAAPACLLLTLADGAAAAGPRLTLDGWRRRVQFVSYLLQRGGEQEEIKKAPRLITGNDLIGELGMTQGPELGHVMSAVDEAVGTGEVRTREEALSYARRLIAGQGEQPEGE